MKVQKKGRNRNAQIKKISDFFLQIVKILRCMRAEVRVSSSDLYMQKIVLAIVQTNCLYFISIGSCIFFLLVTKQIYLYIILNQQILFGLCTSHLKKPCMMICILILWYIYFCYVHGQLIYNK